MCWQMVMKCVQVCVGFALQTFQVPEAISDCSWNALLNYKYIVNKQNKYLWMSVISVRKYPGEHSQKQSACHCRVMHVCGIQNILLR